MKNFNPLISIIIPTFNRKNLICETLESVISQTYINWEMIIVDDGSTDNTSEIIKPFLEEPRISYVERPRNRPGGGNAARNYGYELCKGKYIKWLDSDDLLTPECLEKQLNAIKKERADVVFCRSRFFNVDKENGEKILGEYWNGGFKKKGDLLENFVLGQVRFSNNDGLWKKSILPERPYYENLKNSQEFLMISSILAKNIKVDLMDEVLVWVRSHPNQMPKKRTYAVYSKNQCLARYLLLKELEQNNTINKNIHRYLLKSITYYIMQQCRKSQFLYLKDNLIILIKTSYRFLKL